MLYFNINVHNKRKQYIKIIIVLIIIVSITYAMHVYKNYFFERENSSIQ